MGSQLYALPHTATASSHNMRATLLLGNVTRNLARARLGADVSKTRALLVCQKQLQIESDSLRKTLVTSATRFSDDKKASDQASLAMKIDPKEAAAKKEEKASATKAEAETLKKEKEAKLEAEKLKKEQEAKAAAEKKKKEEEARAKAEKLKKEQEAKAAAEKKRRKKRPELRLRNSRR